MKGKVKCALLLFSVVGGILTLIHLRYSICSFLTKTAISQICMLVNTIVFIHIFNCSLENFPSMECFIKISTFFEKYTRTLGYLQPGLVPLAQPSRFIHQNSFSSQAPLPFLVTTPRETNLFKPYH